MPVKSKRRRRRLRGGCLAGGRTGLDPSGRREWRPDRARFQSLRVVCLNDGPSLRPRPMRPLDHRETSFVRLHQREISECPRHVGVEKVLVRDEQQILVWMRRGEGHHSSADAILDAVGLTGDVRVGIPTNGDVTADELLRLLDAYVAGQALLHGAPLEALLDRGSALAEPVVHDDLSQPELMRDGGSGLQAPPERRRHDQIDLVRPQPARSKFGCIRA
mmetsp:Transcript_95306/g.269410  ORF Transcript_95306/g.269410 Transcript_95306/m.269410 type:complete len:219 (+) Transcript_95306:268-924(+)